ncbi:MAG: preprotein translocase subunit SecY [Nanobdellota archaeon]
MNLVRLIPEVKLPEVKKLGFGTKIKWTISILILYFLLGQVTLFGVAQSTISRYENLAVILGAKFGTLITLGIGPIVTASIILQLLNGSGLFKFDTSTEEGKKKFQGIQKITAYGFIIFESIVYVMLGGLSPDPALQGTGMFGITQFIIIAQLILGGMMILLMDEVVQKWGIGSGVSLFIASGVSQQIFVKLFSPMKAGSDYSVGAIWAFIQSLQAGDLNYSILMASSVIFTFLIFAIAIFAQSMKVEVPLSFGRVRGHGIRWPLNFMYTSNIPVILIAALLANLQIGAQLLSKAFPAINPEAVRGWVTGPQLIPLIIKSKTVFVGLVPYLQVLVYLMIFIIGATIFSWFWVQSAGMDPKSQAKKIIKSGLQMPGFRKDPRIMEKVLGRYINPLTIMGAITVAVLAVLADISGALGSGTGILLTVMILYRFYEDIAKKHMADMNPAMRNFMGGE